MNQPYQVIIVGGGPAGMSAALVLGRSRIKTLILSTEKPRNAVTTHSHGFLTQDGKHPNEILAVAKEQLGKYAKVDYKIEKAISISPQESGFTVQTELASYETTRVIIATGHKDNIAAIGIAGLTEVYGKSVYPCPFCDGFEMADKKLAVIGDGMMAPMFAKTIAHWSDDVMVFTNGHPVDDQEVANLLTSNGVPIVTEKIAQLESVEGILHTVVLEDGTRIAREGGFLPDTMSTESTSFAKDLNVPTEMGEYGMEAYQVDDNKETGIKGLYLIGDARTGWSGVASCVAEGSEVGAAITHQIVAERWG